MADLLSRAMQPTTQPTFALCNCNRAIATVQLQLSNPIFQGDLALASANGLLTLSRSRDADGRICIVSGVGLPACQGQQQTSDNVAIDVRINR